MKTTNKTFTNKIKDALCNNDINFLIEHKGHYSIDERFEDEDNDTLLMYSISDPNSEAFQYLIDNGASLNLINDEGDTIVHSAIFSGKVERVKLVITDTNININNKDEVTPLLLSCSLAYEGIAIELLNLGANPNCSDNNGLQAIHIASQEGMENLVLKLLNVGASCYSKTKNGNLPIALAANSGNSNIVKILYKYMYT